MRYPHLAPGLIEFHLLHTQNYLILLVLYFFKGDL